MKALIKAGLLTATLAGLAAPALAQPDQNDKGAQSDHRGEGRGNGRGGGDHGGRGNDGGGRPAPAAAPAPAPAPPPQAPVARVAPPVAPAPPAAQFQPRQGDGGRQDARGGYGYRQRGIPSDPTPPPVQQAAPQQAYQPQDRRGFTGDQSRPNGAQVNDRNWQIREDARRAEERNAQARDENRRGNDVRDRNWNGNRDDNRGGDRNWNDNRGDRGNGQNWRQGSPRPPVNARPPVANRWNGVRRWDNNGWRNDRRYNWQSWRYSHRDVFRLPRYYAPYGWDRNYVRFSIGTYLDDLLFGESYWIDDPWTYHLPPVYGPLRWVRYYNDAVLVDIRDGYVVDVIYDVFW